MLAESKSTEKFKELLKKAVKRLQSRGFDEIKTSLDGFDNPIGFSQKKSDVEYTPDLTAKNHKGVCYFEIAQKTNDITRLVSKWKLLSTIADMRDSKFTILIPYGHNKFTQELVDQYKIKANLMRLD